MGVDLLKHNQEAYEKVKEILRINNKTCVIQPTGSGKTHLILKLIEDYAEQVRDIIVIEPQKYIFEQLQKKMKKYELSSDNIKFLTYSALGKLDNEKIQEYDSPKLVLVDEMHRAGAPIWGSGLQKMFDVFPDDCKYIGFSATPIRYLDKKRNMAEELFDGCIASEISLADAILNRTLPLPRYIAGLYTYENEFNAITRKIQKSYNSDKEKVELLEEVAVMKRNLDKSKGISAIFKKYINQGKGKYIAFCRNINHLKQMKSCLEKWFSEAGITCIFYEVHCKNPEKDDQFNAFMDDEGLSVCLSVAMLSEGVHGIDGVILLRDTISPNLYYQQIGRVFAVDMDTVPIIFDLVANCESIMDCSLKNDLLNAIDKRDKDNEYACVNDGQESEEVRDSDDCDRKEITKGDIESFFVFDQVIDVINIFNCIEKRLEGSWDMYIKALERYRKREGDSLVSQNHIEVMEDGTEVKLGQWVSNIRNSKQGKGEYSLTPDKIDQLNELNFIFNVDKFLFEKNVDDCISFYINNGRKPNFKNVKEKKLAKFWSRNANATKLPQWKIELLKQIPTFFDIEEKPFDIFCNMVEIYKKRFGNVNIKSNDIIDDYNIGSILWNLKNNYKNGKLTEDKVKKLKDIGLDIGERKNEQEFNKKMELARIAVTEGIILSKENPIYKGINFYNWKYTHKDKFTDDEIDLMDRLVQKRKRRIRLIDDKTNQIVNIYTSISEASKALCDEFHIVKNRKRGKSAIEQRLSGKIKTPVYKGFRFEYADNERCQIK